jgi:hypothetical protein
VPSLGLFLHASVSGFPERGLHARDHLLEVSDPFGPDGVEQQTHGSGECA